jgi:hypothetical protein
VPQFAARSLNTRPRRDPEPLSAAFRLLFGTVLSENDLAFISADRSKFFKWNQVGADVSELMQRSTAPPNLD